MREELDKKLCEEFPNLYRERSLPMDQSCLSFGFEVPNTWFDILYELSKKLDALYKDLPKDDEYPAVIQVKEKFGGLRYYMGSIPEHLSEKTDEYVQEAEDKSYRTCEECGKEGKNRSIQGWLSVLCETHYQERLKND
jgi:hypothetical protein